MGKYSTGRVFVATCAGMGFFGVAMFSLAPILGQLNGIVDGVNGLPSTLSLGILLGTIVFGPVVDRFGYKGLFVLSSTLVLAGLQGLAHFTSLWLLHLSILCIGFGGGVLNGETNAMVSNIYDDRTRGGRLGILGAFYCIGALLWSFLNYLIPEFRVPLSAVSIVMTCCIVFSICISFPASKGAEKESMRSSARHLRFLSLLLFALVLFFESGFEGAQGNFSVSFFSLGGGIDITDAKLAITWFTIGMMLGRLLLGMIFKKLGNLGTLYSYLGLALTGVIMMMSAPSVVVVAHVSMVLIGFGVGATYPVILNYIGGTFREHSGTAISISMFIAILGQYLFNLVTGKAFDAGHYCVLPILMIVAEICMMIITPIAVRYVGKSEK